MIQRPSATDLWQIADLWANMQEELAQTVAWRRGSSDPSPSQRPADPVEQSGADKSDATAPTTGSAAEPSEESAVPAEESPAQAHESPGATLESQKAAYEQQLRDWYRDPAVFMLVGVRMMGDERVGEVVAFMVSRLEDAQPRFGRIIDLYVQPSLRGNKLARNMVEAASGWMRAQKGAFLEASVLTSNRSGMGFLASTEFQLHSSVLRKRL